MILARVVLTSYGLILLAIRAETERHTLRYVNVGSWEAVGSEEAGIHVDTVLRRVY